MRMIIALCATLAITFAADAKPKKAKFQGKLLSYSQLMMLPTQKRVAYMRDVASLLAYMEKSQRKHNLAKNSEFQELKEQFAQLMRMMAIVPEAEAQTANSAGRRRAEMVPRWDERQKTWFCRGDKVAFDPALGTCAYHNGSSINSPDAGSFFKRRGSCSPESMVEIEVGDSVKCIPNVSWEALSRQRQNELRNGMFLTEKFWKDHKGVASTIPYVHGAGRHNIDGTLRESDSVPPTATTPPVAQAPSAQKPPATDGGTLKPVPPVAELKPVPPSGETLKPVPPSGEVLRPVPAPGESVKPTQPEPQVAKPVPVEPPAEPSTPTEGEKPTPEVPADPKCEAPKFACETLNPSQKDDLIRKFRANKEADMCISGGFFTNVKSKRTVTAPVCEIKTAHDFGNNKVTSCKGRNEALCNPVVFCVGLKIDDDLRKLADPKKGKAEVKKVFGAKPEDIFKAVAAKDSGSGGDFIQMNVCVKSGQDITEKCNTAVQDYLDGRSSTFGKKPLGENYMACDPAKVEGLKFQQGWNELRDNVEKYFQAYCVGGSARDFKELFCRECEIISARIMAMNYSAAGDACAVVQPTAGTAVPASGSPEAIREKEEDL